MLPVVNPAVPAAAELQIGDVANQRENRQDCRFFFTFFTAKIAMSAKKKRKGRISLRFSLQPLRSLRLTPPLEKEDPFCLCRKLQQESDE